MKKKCCMILIYMGHWPSYWPLFFYSLTMNPAFNFLIIGDKVPKFSKANNIKVLEKNLNEIRQDFAKLLKRDVALFEPYKLCDFKVIYGHLFEEQIKNYRFWGIIDNDIILGDLSKFVTCSILDSHDKIYSRGHMTIFRNTPELNLLYQDKVEGVDWEEVVCSSRNFAFDEWNGIHKISLKNNVKTYLADDICDVDRRHYDVRSERSERIFPQTVFYKDGQIYHHLYGRSPLERAYVHLQKRPMRYEKISEIRDSYIYVGPDRFIERKSLAVSKHEMRAINSPHLLKSPLWRLKIVRRRLGNLSKKISAYGNTEG